jgi:hypothetical protein
MDRCSLRQDHNPRRHIASQQRPVKLLANQRSRVFNFVMSDTRTNSLSKSPDRAAVIPLLVWLLIQLAALALGASQTPPSARWTVESFALDEMLVAQVMSAALLFPLLLPNLRAAVLIAATSVPFSMLAGTLAGIANHRIATGCAPVVLWLAALAAFRRACIGRTMEVIGLLAATAISIGLPVAFYLNREFSGDAAASTWLIPLSPTTASIAAAHGINGGWMWVSPATLFAVALTIAWRRRAPRRAFDSLSTTSSAQIPTSGG